MSASMPLLSGSGYLLFGPVGKLLPSSVFPFRVARFRPYFAILLLLAFVRVLLPDSAVLALHSHTHTAHEAAHDIKSRLKGKTVVAEKHTHCPTDHLFNAPALPAPVFAFGVVMSLKFRLVHELPGASVWTARLRQTLCLRGPPPTA